MYSVVVPVYNEEDIIVKNISKLDKHLKGLEKKLKEKINLIVMDDGSTDNTFMNLIKMFQKSNTKKIEYTFYTGPSRRENLLKHIYNEIDTEYTIFMDCDLATDLVDLEPLLVNLKYYDIVTGSRYLASSKTKRTLGRLIISFLFNSGVRLGFGSKIRDHECGFKAFKTSVLKNLIKHTDYGEHKKSRKMFWDSEMWVCAQKLNYKILEIPISWKAGQKSALRFKSELPLIWYAFKFWVSGRWLKSTKKNLISLERTKLIGGSKPKKI